ncbi:MAG: hypothetical protein LW808_002765 [Verrucomicrobiota bacterium]|nr:MAG: hypothetical protein LW808_002765 [Verrucomicrobiota bacterium]
MKKDIIKTLSMTWLLIPAIVSASSSKCAWLSSVVDGKISWSSQMTLEKRFYFLLSNIMESIRKWKSLGANAGFLFDASGSEIKRTKILINFWVLIGSLIKKFGEEQYQIDEKGAQVMLEMFRIIASEEWVLRDQLYQRRVWVQETVKNTKPEYFTRDGLKTWEDGKEALLAVCQKTIPDQCFQQLTKRFEDFSQNSKPKSEDCKKLAADIRKVRDAVLEMRRSKVRDAVTENEMLVLMNSFSKIFPTSRQSPVSEEKQKIQDLLYSSGVLEAFTGLVMEIYPIYVFDLLMEPVLCDSDAGEAEWKLVKHKEQEFTSIQRIAWKLKYFKSRELVDVCDQSDEDDEGNEDNKDDKDDVVRKSFFLSCVSPKNRDNPKWMRVLNQKFDEKGDFSQMILTSGLHKWRSRGTSGAGKVMRSPLMHRMIKELLRVVRDKNKQ